MPDPQSTVGFAPAVPKLTSLREEERLFLFDFLEASLQYRERFSRGWNEMRDNYLVSPFGPDYPSWMTYGNRASITSPSLQPMQGRGRRSVLKDPETHQVTETLLAQGLTLMLGQPEFISATPIGSDDREKAQLVGRLIQAVLEQPGVYGTFYRALKDSFIFGTAIVEVGWAARSRKQVAETPVLDGDGRVIGTGIVPQEVLHKQGVQYRTVDIWDFYPDPSGTRIHDDMELVAKRFRITAQQALDLAEAGVYQKDATMRAISNAKSRRVGGSIQDRRGEERFKELASVAGPNRTNMLSGFEAWGRFPIVYPNGETNRVVTMLEGEIVRSSINPFLDGNIPFKEITVNPMTGRFYGVSPAEVIRFLQDSADSMLMNLTDAGDLMTRPTLLMGMGFGGDPKRLRRREFNDIIDCANPDMVKDLPVNFTALDVAASEMLRRKVTMREASGATNPLQSIPSSDRQTATEISELTRLASQRSDVMIRLIERDDMPMIGRMTHSRLRQFLPDEGAIAVLNGEPLRVSLADIDIDADVRFSGSRSAMSKFQLGASLREFFNVIGQNPIMLQVAPEYVIQYGRDVLGLVDAEQVTQLMIQRLGLVMQQQAAQAGANTGSQEQGFGTEVGQTEKEGRRVS